MSSILTLRFWNKFFQASFLSSRSIKKYDMTSSSNVVLKPDRYSCGQYQIQKCCLFSSIYALFLQKMFTPTKMNNMVIIQIFYPAIGNTIFLFSWGQVDSFSSYLQARKLDNKQGYFISRVIRNLQEQQFFVCVIPLKLIFYRQKTT